MIRFFILWGAFFYGLVSMMTVPVPAMAQDNHAVQVRTGIHEDYARLVFDGRTKSLPYNFTRSSPSVLSLEFPGAERIDIGQAGLADIAVIENIDIRQEQSGLVAEIVIKSGLSVRHFTIGNRVIVDVMAGDTSMRATAPQNIPEKAQEPKKTPVPPPGMPGPRTLTRPVVKRLYHLPSQTKRTMTTAMKLFWKPRWGKSRMS